MGEYGYEARGALSTWQELSSVERAISHSAPGNRGAQLQSLNGEPLPPVLEMQLGSSAVL